MYRALESDELDPSPALIAFIMIGTCYGALRENQDFRLENPVEQRILVATAPQEARILTGVTWKELKTLPTRPQSYSYMFRTEWNVHL